jgi:hypothetical protein
MLALPLACNLELKSCAHFGSAETESFSCFKNRTSGLEFFTPTLVRGAFPRSQLSKLALLNLLDMFFPFIII